MPTYVYRCKNCEHQFETVQKINDEPLTQCPECAGKLARLLFPPVISFKGSGFHINDYPDTRSMVNPDSNKSEAKEPASKSDS